MPSKSCCQLKGKLLQTIVATAQIPLKFCILNCVSQRGAWLTRELKAITESRRGEMQLREKCVGRLHSYACVCVRVCVLMCENVTFFETDELCVDAAS